MCPKIIKGGLQCHDRDTRDRLRQCLIVPLAKARSTRITRGTRLLRRRSPTEKHVGSPLLSTAARDPGSIPHPLRHLWQKWSETTANPAPGVLFVTTYAERSASRRSQ